MNLSCGLMVKNPPAIQETRVSIPRSGKSPREGNEYQLEYSCLEKSMDRGGWRVTVHNVTELDMTE